MNKNDISVQACIQKLYDFRSKIPANLTKKKVFEVWDTDFKENLLLKNIEERKEILEEKEKILNRSLDWLVLGSWVKFIGISGSIASEFVKEDDDIDLFIVVKNDRAWIYRLYIYFKNIFEKKIRSKEKSNKGESVKDKFCINLITEERCLSFEPDLFNLNELIYLKAVYNKNFLKIIFLSNQWLKEKYLVSEKFLKREKVTVKEVKELTKRNYFLFIFNFISFVGQLLFMFLMRHKPDVRRLWKGFRKGRIEFYPKDFREEKLKFIKVN